MEREDADSRTLELGSDLIMGLGQLQLEVAGIRRVRNERRHKRGAGLGGVKSLSGGAWELLNVIKRGVEVAIYVNDTPAQTSSTDDSEMMEQRNLRFTTPERLTQFFAKKALDLYNEYNPDAELMFLEGITSNKLVSNGMPYIHINCKVQDMDGNEQLFFAETTDDQEPILVTHCILELGDSGDYCHHQLGCGWCDPDASVPMYHPSGGYLHGDNSPEMDNP